MKAQEIEVRDASLKELNRQLNRINKQIDNLIDERFSKESVFTQEELDE